MPLPDIASDWMLYGSLTAGCVGAVAGLVGLAMGRAALKRNVEVRALDLRLRLGRIESELQETISELPRTMQRAERSNLTLATASGIRQTTAAGWQREVDHDFATLAQLEAAVPSMGGDYALLKVDALEARVLAAYQFQSKAHRLDSKYRTVLAKDHNRRLQLADDRRVLLEAKLWGNSQF